MPQMGEDKATDFAIAMGSAKMIFEQNYENGKAQFDITEALDKYPDMDPFSPYFHISDVEFESREKKIRQAAVAAEMYRSSSVAIPNAQTAVSILEENERMHGAEHKRLSCELALLEHIEKKGQHLDGEKQHFGDHVMAGMAINKRAQLLNNKTEDQLKYEDTFTALEKIYGISSPMLSRSLDKSGDEYLRETYSEFLSGVPNKGVEKEPFKGLIDVKICKLFQPGAARKSFINDRVSQMSDEEAMRMVATSAMAECNTFASMISGEVNTVAPHFDWTKTVFLNGQPLNERVDRVMNETHKIDSHKTTAVAFAEGKPTKIRELKFPDKENTPPNYRALVTASVLSSAIMDKNCRVNIPEFNHQTKRFDDKLLRIENHGLKASISPKNPKMNLWKRFWNLFGRYKDTQKLQKEFDLKQELGKKVNSFNDEIEREIEISAIKAKLPTIVDETNIGRDLGDLVYEKMPESRKQNLTDADRIMASGMLVAELMTKHDMPLERALNARMNILEKDDAADKVAALLEDPDDNTWCNLVMPGAELLLSNKPKVDFREGLLGAGADLKNVAFQGKYLEQLAINMVEKKGEVTNWLTAHPENFPAFRDDTPDKRFERLHDVINVASKLYNGMAQGYTMIAKDAPAEYLQPKDDDKTRIAELSNALFAKHISNSRGPEILDGVKDLTLLDTQVVNEMSNTAQAISSRVSASMELPKEDISNRTVVKLEKDLGQRQTHLLVMDLTGERNKGDLEVLCDYNEDVLQKEVNIAVASKQQIAAAVSAAVRLQGIEAAFKPKAASNEEKEHDKPAPKEEKEQDKSAPKEQKEEKARAK